MGRERRLGGPESEPSDFYRVAAMGPGYLNRVRRSVAGPLRNMSIFFHHPSLSQININIMHWTYDHSITLNMGPMTNASCPSVKCLDRSRYCTHSSFAGNLLCTRSNIRLNWAAEFLAEWAKSSSMASFISCGMPFRSCCTTLGSV
jgi:hypothetical protein